MSYWNYSACEGADVQHPAPGAENKPSFTAVVGSVDQLVSKYVATSALQVGRQELIDDLQSMTKVCNQCLYFTVIVFRVYLFARKSFPNIWGTGKQERKQIIPLLRNSFSTEVQWLAYIHDVWSHSSQIRWCIWGSVCPSAWQRWVTMSFVNFPL